MFCLWLLIWLPIKSRAKISNIIFMFSSWLFSSTNHFRFLCWVGGCDMWDQLDVEESWIKGRIVRFLGRRIWFMYLMPETSISLWGYWRLYMHLNFFSSESFPWELCKRGIHEKSIHFLIWWGDIWSEWSRIWSWRTTRLMQPDGIDFD